jgi:hypothetical protein
MIIQEKKKDFPVIYLRYLNNKLVYIGESSSFIRARHAREESLKEAVGDFDVVKILKAPKNKKRRKYWEAWLICKLKPTNQRSELYRHLIEKGNGREWKRSIKKIIYKNDIDIRKNTLSRLLKLKKLIELTNSR